MSVEQAGYLTKSDASGKSWKRRFFLLNASIRTLEYYEKDTLKQFKGSFPLTGASISVAAAATNSKSPRRRISFASSTPTQFRLTLQTKGRTTILCAATAVDMQAWLAARSTQN